MRKLAIAPLRAGRLLATLGLAASSGPAQVERWHSHDRRGVRLRQTRGSVTRAALALFAATAVTAGCASTSSTRPPSGSTRPPSGTSHSPVTTPTGTTDTGLIGRWERMTTCQQLVSELDKAGLAPLAPYAWRGQTSSTGQGSYAAGSPKPTKAHPCTGALNRAHSHFFSPSGQFGSLDWLGGQVDNGPYRIINNKTVYIGSSPSGATFHYRILHGDTLMLSPVLTKAMLRQALAHPQKFGAALWAVSVAYAGSTWKRVPCQSWC
jgi:hypothetical protein